MDTGRQVRHFRQILLWPLQLMRQEDGSQIQRHWESLECADPENPWREVDDEFTADPSAFQVRHYAEFVTFLPHVQRFLYGEGKEDGYGSSPIRVFRRHDVAGARVTFKSTFAPLDLEVVHVDLYFFYDLDVVILTVEVCTDDIGLDHAQELLFRFGRSYPDSWDENGEGTNCLRRVEWLGRDGAVLAASDYEDRSKFLTFVARHRAAAMAAHWEFLMLPLVAHHSDRPGVLRYRPLEYDRMPHLCYLAVDEPQALTRGDFVRLALGTRSGDPDTLPFSDRSLYHFEDDHCLDRYWQPQGRSSWANVRFLCSRHAFVAVGDGREPFVTDRETGLLGQFRHQYFVLALIAHLHKAALLMLSDRLVAAVSRLDIRDPESIRRFKRVIRQTFEIFLRFTHRNFFEEVSIQAPAKAVFDLWRRHLGIDTSFRELREEVQDMAQYLDSDGFRRQANTVLRLTVVTIFGLVGTLSTGFLGMNLFDWADASPWMKLAIFAVVFVPMLFLTLYTVVLSKGLSDFLEAVSDERLTLRSKVGALMRALTRQPSAGRPPSSSRLRSPLDDDHGGW